MADDLSPVELLLRAVDSLRGDPEYPCPPMPNSVAYPLADLLERDAALIQIKGWDYPPTERDALKREYVDAFYRNSLEVARGVLGVPDGR